VKEENKRHLQCTVSSTCPTKHLDLEALRAFGAYLGVYSVEVLKYLSNCRVAVYGMPGVAWG
jgi:hypothetical protein